jgi:hypothetical protein
MLRELGFRLTFDSEIKKVVSVKTLQENNEDEDDQEEEPVVKRNCTIDLSMFV